MEQELEKKIEEALEETFVGNYVFTDQEIDKIIDDVSSKFRIVCKNRGENLKISDYNEAFVAIVNLTRKWGSVDIDVTPKCCTHFLNQHHR